jgi:hypothetical protein
MQLSNQMRKLGWKCFLVMWIPFTTLMISMAGLPEGSYSYAELPVLARYSLFLIGIFFVAAFALIFGAPVIPYLHTRRVRKHGQPAEAEVIDIQGTNTYINRRPLVRLMLEVRPKVYPIFEAETEYLIPGHRLGKFEPGEILQVRFDPESHVVAVVDE